MKCCLFVLVVSVQCLGIEESESLGEDVVTQSSCKTPNPLVPFARLQEGEELVSGVCGVTHSADLLTLPHYLITMI